MEAGWKPDWKKTAENFRKWWDREGLLLGTWSPCRDPAPGRREPAPDPGEAGDLEEYWTGPEYRAAANHHLLAGSIFPGDVIPAVNTSFGPGTFSLFMGAEPGFSRETVWYEPCIDPRDPENHPSLRFNPENKWFQRQKKLLELCMENGRGRYLGSLPDLIENIDTLAALRGTEPLLMDLIERPGWVKQKLSELNKAWFEAYGRLYDIIKCGDGSSVFSAFSIWGPGKTAKVQCDASAMFSPAMFAEFVVPPLREQCEWLDHSMFHLDGHQCIPHLDHLLGIEALDAVEWTPDPQVPPGTDPEWIPMYTKILAAGKCVQILGGNSGTIRPILDEVGGKGVYFLLSCPDMDDFERCLKIGEEYNRT